MEHYVFLIIGIFGIVLSILFFMGDKAISMHKLIENEHRDSIEMARNYKLYQRSKNLFLLLISVILLFACKKEINVKPTVKNLVDSYSGKYVDALNDTLTISLSSTSVGRNTYTLVGLKLMIKKNFNDSTTITTNSNTGYSTGNGSLYIDNIGLAGDGLSYVRVNFPNSLGYGNYSRTLIKLP